MEIGTVKKRQAEKKQQQQQSNKEKNEISTRDYSANTTLIYANRKQSNYGTNTHRSVSCCTDLVQIFDRQTTLVRASIDCLFYIYLCFW